MPYGLARGDASRLEEGLQLLLSPLDFKDSVAWRGAICHHLMNWIHTDGVHVTLTRSGDPPMLGIGRWGSEVEKEYIARWHDRAEIDRLRDERGLRAWVRHDVLSEEAFRRTKYFREFCSQINFFDSCGAIHHFQDGEKAILHLTSARPGTFRSDGRTFQILRLLQPALAAGGLAYRTASSDHALLGTDGAIPPIALMSADGRMLHASPALASLLSRPAAGVAIRHLIQAVTRDASRLLRERPGEVVVRPHRTVTSRGESIGVRATLVNHLTGVGPPACLVMVTYSTKTQSEVEDRPSALTPREVEVARMLAAGLRNREIAGSLDVSEHTARRHTENILRKLGLRSRAGVAAALTRLSSRDVRNVGS